jgi:hypothetical protein
LHLSSLCRHLYLLCLIPLMCCGQILSLLINCSGFAFRISTAVVSLTPKYSCIVVSGICRKYS